MDITGLFTVFYLFPSQHICSLCIGVNILWPATAEMFSCIQVLGVDLFLYYQLSSTVRSSTWPMNSTFGLQVVCVCMCFLPVAAYNYASKTNTVLELNFNANIDSDPF